MRFAKFIFSLLCLFVFLKASGQDMVVQGGFTWQGNNHFTLHSENDELHVDMNKLNWECFSMIIDEQDFSQNPKLTLDVKSDKIIDLRVDVLDYTNSNLTISPKVKNLSNIDQFVTLEYDFSDMEAIIDFERIHHFQFFINPGENYDGNLIIKNVFLGDTPTRTNTFEKDMRIKLFPNPTEGILTIKSEEYAFDQIRVWDNLGRVVFIQNYHPTLLEKISVADFPEGIFYIELKFQNQRIYTNTFARQVR